MRPQRFSCGIVHSSTIRIAPAIASMRPQRFSCGIDTNDTDRPSKLDELQ